MTTLKEIAELAGVSRGTVDRVLNNRGSVNPQTEQKILDIVQKLDYRPNKAGTVLAAQKKKYRIGVILFSENNPFFDEVSEGVTFKATELADYGLTTLTRRVEFDVDAQLKAIEELAGEGIHGLVITPYNDIRIKERINALTAMNIPVVTVNTDIVGSSRIAYVGSDSVQGGRMAAGLFALMTAGPAKLAIITGSTKVLNHSERVSGLREVLKSSYPHIRITEILENHDDDIESYNIVKDLLVRQPDIDALFFAAGGVYGGCRALLESGLHPRVVSFDEVPTTIEMLKKGVICTTISQQPYRQGAHSLDILFEYLTSGLMPQSEMHYVEHSIRIRENT